MITTTLGLMAVAALSDIVAVPYLKLHSPRVTSVAWLSAFRAVMVMVGVLLVLCAVWVFLAWWGLGFPLRGAYNWIYPFCTAGSLLFAHGMLPPAWLNARIDGLLARRSATEDRPDWEESTRGR